MKTGTHVTWTGEAGEAVSGHIVAFQLDGALCQTADGRLRHVNPKDLTEIPPPVVEPPPIEPSPKNFQTHHPLDGTPHGLPVLVAGKWSEPQ